jgi:hypothetical protein
MLVYTARSSTDVPGQTRKKKKNYLVGKYFETKNSDKLSRLT